MLKLQSIKYGRWSLLQVISCILAFTLFFINCSPESFSGGEALDQQTSLPPIGDGDIGLYDMLEIFRTLENVKDFQSSDATLEYVIGTEAYEQTATMRQQMLDEVEAYKSQEFDNYIIDAHERGLISSNIKQWLVSYQVSLNSFIDTNPDADAAADYFSNLDNFIFSESYSTTELDLIERMSLVLKDFSKYYYLHFSDSNLDMQDGAQGIDLRDPDCNFLEGFFCTLLWAGVLALIIWQLHVALGAGVAAGGGGYQIIKGGIVVASGTTDLTDELAITAGILLFALFTKLWTSFYEWCCGKKEEAFCSPPIGNTIKELDCNEFEIIFYGAGDYTTTVWKNDNANPETAITPTPILQFTVPEPNELTTLEIIPTICTALPSGIVTPYKDIAKGILNQFSAAWDITPPATIVLSNLESPDNPDWFFANVKANELLSGFSNSSSYTYEWSITGDHNIMPQGPKAHIALDINDLGVFTIAVKVTDVCTGATQSVSKNINLIQ